MAAAVACHNITPQRRRSRPKNLHIDDFGPESPLNGGLASGTGAVGDHGVRSEGMPGGACRLPLFYNSSTCCFDRTTLGR